MIKLGPASLDALSVRSPDTALDIHAVTTLTIELVTFVMAFGNTTHHHQARGKSQMFWEVLYPPFEAKMVLAPDIV